MMHKVKKVRAIVCEPNKPPRVEMLEDSLDEWQELVRGTIEVIYPHDDDSCMIMNDEGKLERLDANRALKDGDGNIYDVVAGTLAIVRAPADSDMFASLTDEQVEKYLRMYADTVDAATADKFMAPFMEFVPMDDLPWWDREY